MTIFTIIFYSFVSILFIYAIHYTINHNPDKEYYLNLINNFYGRKHTSLIVFNGGGGDINFDEMSETELTNYLRNDFNVWHNWKYPCINAKHPSHIAEYRILLRDDKVKTIGWITKDKVVFEGKEYIFDKEEENDL